MANSTRIIDYLGQGTLAARPATLTGVISATALGFYYATDNTTLYSWNSNTAAWVVAGGGINYNVFASGTFTARNQNSSTLSNASGPLTFTDTADPGSDKLTMWYQAVPGTNYTITAFVNFTISGVYATVLGLDDGSAKTYNFMIGPGTSGYTNTILVQHWASFSSAAGSATDYTQPISIPNPCWFRVTWVNASTTVTFQYSIDGINWITAFTTSSPTFTPVNFWIGGDMHNITAACQLSYQQLHS